MSLVAPLLALALGIPWTPVPTGPPPEPAPKAATDHGVWDRLAACESNGRWDIATGNGYYGGLQFDLRSWGWAVDVGGHDVPARPDHATRTQQIAVAETLLAIHPAGWGAWPACSRKLGLRP